jgi:hypothetical protein
MKKFVRSLFEMEVWIYENLQVKKFVQLAFSLVLSDTFGMRCAGTAHGTGHAFTGTFHGAGPGREI